MSDDDPILRLPPVRTYEVEIEMTACLFCQRPGAALCAMHVRQLAAELRAMQRRPRGERIMAAEILRMMDAPLLAGIVAPLPFEVERVREQ